jgi:hypothetical protein
MHGFNKPTRAKAQARRPKPSPKFLEQFNVWLYQVHHDPEFTSSALAIMLEIAWPMSSLGQYSWPSLDTIAERCNLSKSRVGELVNKLVARGHLLAEGGSPGRGHSTHYRINIIGAASAPVTSLKVIVADVLDRDPTPLKGTLAGPLDTEPRTLKGTLAGQNKKERKKELRDRVPKPTESAVRRALSDRVPVCPRAETTSPDAASLPVKTTVVDATVIPEIKSAPDGALILGEESKPTNTVSLDAAFYKRGVDVFDDGGAANGREAHGPVSDAAVSSGSPIVVPPDGGAPKAGPALAPGFLGGPDKAPPRNGGVIVAPPFSDHRKVRIIHDMPGSYRAFYAGRGAKLGAAARDQDCSTEILKLPDHASRSDQVSVRRLENRAAGFSSEIRLHKPEESAMPKLAPDPAVIAANDVFFDALLEAYPRRDAADAARAALHEVLSEADNPGQFRVCLLEGIERYEADMRAKGKHGFMTLRAFIEDGEKWRPEYLPFNLAQAA